MGLVLGTARNGQRALVLQTDEPTPLPNGQTAETGHIIPLVADVAGLARLTIETTYTTGCAESTLAAEELVWEHGGAYTYLTAPGVVALASDDGADVGNTITVLGIVDGLAYAEDVTTNGLTPVSTVALFSRVYSAENTGSAPLLGLVSIEGTGGDSGTVLAEVGAAQSSAQAIWTCPTDRLGFLASVSVNTGGGDEVKWGAYVRRLGEVFRRVAAGIVESDTDTRSFNTDAIGGGIPVPPGADLELRAVRLSGGPAKRVSASLIITTAPVPS